MYRTPTTDLQREFAKQTAHINAIVRKSQKEHAARPFRGDPIAVRIGRAYRVGLAAHVDAGRLLREKKDSLKHGKWLPWLKANAGALGFDSDRTAQRLIKLAAENPTLASDLPAAGLKAATQELWGHGKRAPEPRDPEPSDPESLIKSVDVTQPSTALRPIPIITDHDTSLAVAFINKHHARRDAALNNKLAIVALIDDVGQLLGVGVLSRPSGGDGSDWTTTAEISRVCVRRDCDVPHGCRILITALDRMTKAWGYLQIKSFTELDESGASYLNAGWKDDGETRPGRDGDSKRRWVKDSEPRWRKAKPYDKSIHGSVRETDAGVAL